MDIRPACFIFNPDGSVKTCPLKTTKEALVDLQDDGPLRQRTPIAARAKAEAFSWKAHHSPLFAAIDSALTPAKGGQSAIA